MTGTAATQQKSLASRHLEYTEAMEHCEGSIARAIEKQTAKLSSDTFLWAALGSIGISLYFELKGDSEKSRFVGEWAAPLLLLGVYNKLVKISGSDRVS